MDIEVILPTLHSGQVDVFKARKQLNVIRCGRRWGKTRLLETIASSSALAGKSVGIFAPEYRQLGEPYDHILKYIGDAINYKNKMVKIRTKTGGTIDFWRLNDNELAGRGYEYDYVLIDEGSFTKSPQMLDIWQKSIKPTMLTTRGKAWVFSTPNGLDPDNFFWRICNDPEMGFTEFYAPTSTNPYVPLDELEKERKLNHPLVFQQEYLAEFIDWSGIAFFAIPKLLENGNPVSYPYRCDAVYCVLDTAVKGGQEHDGTAVIYMALISYPKPKLIILDWDIVQIDGAMLESWMPSVFYRAERLAEQCNSRSGFTRAFVEDINSGSILLQQGKNRGWNMEGIPNNFTSKGKDERAISVSGYFHQELCKISDVAYNKTVSFKTATRNHLLSQVAQFRIGDPDAHKRSDDLLDAFVYAIALGVGNKFAY